MKSLSTLQIALGISVAVHAALLTVRLVDPERFDSVFQDTPLEIILVNAKSDAPPEKATAIAQASLEGGGEQEKGRATSPLQPSALIKLGDTEEDETQQKIAALKAQQTQLLLQVKQALSAMPLTDLSMPASTASEIEQQEKRKKLVKLLAEIEKRVNAENARPKKRYISPATREAAYALYYNALRRKIEAKGTQNFPQLAGKKLYGQLTMTLTINFDGRVPRTTAFRPGSPSAERQVHLKFHDNRNLFNHPAGQVKWITILCSATRLPTASRRKFMRVLPNLPGK